MSNTATFTTRLLALVLAMAMVLSMAACGKTQDSQDQQSQAGLQQHDGAAQQESNRSDGSAAQSGGQGNDLGGVQLPVESDRESLEQIVEILGDGQSAEDLTDEELGALVEDLVGDLESEQTGSGIVNLGGTQTESPSVDVTGNEGVYDEDGAMSQPFDQVYPELIEKEQVSFSGESILVKMKNDTLTDGLKAAGVGALERIVPLDGCAWYEAKLTESTDAQEALAAVRELSEVLLAEYNYEIQTAAIDDYKHFDKEQEEDFKKNGHNKDQWHFHHVGIPDGYEQMQTQGGDSSVVVAVIDTGVDYDHEDLKDNMWFNAGEIPNNNIDDDKNGYIDDYYGIDLIAGKGSADDDNGHGTHVAGIIAARNNNVGVLGIAYGAKIMPIKAAMHNGTLNQADIAKAVLYAYEMGAEVINMSFGGSACSIAVQDALAVAYTRSVLVASAGNSGYPNEPSDNALPLPNYPAALSYVLGVMSVDENGVESSFTNWDTKAFNGVEYELYAPGENIMSTLPNNQYGFLTGTSMAAPMVSAMAAILRSEFADRDMYPTKFIYGQLSSTSDYYADCIDPEGHAVNGKMHNLPQIVNLDAALTKLPKPEVNLQDYAIFDSKELSDKNNGDGVIDAGETIALGLTLRNRWGMSENTLVTVDTLENGIADPYVTIVNPTVDYGSVGTYSTQDCGKIFTDALQSGWENPFILKIADDIPNDYRMTFHVTIRCENALDEADTATYEATGDIDLTARNGVVLPSIIEEDMVLTADNLYIIPNSTVITEGTTVRVEPGTHIQFWSDDASDPYADSYIAFLQVEGKFLVEGTKEDPVYIYPSELMSNYIVDLGEANNGLISLRYADITNLSKHNTSDSSPGVRGISYAYGCTFRQNYSSSMTYRYMSNGTTRENPNYDVRLETIKLAEKCVFYKLGNNHNDDISADYGVMLWGTADTCIFVDCGMELETDLLTARNCVFLGNALYEQTNPDVYDNSTLMVSTSFAATSNKIDTYYCSETGTTYVGYSSSGRSDRESLRAYLARSMSGGYAVIQTQEELTWLQSKALQSQHGSVKMGIRKDSETGKYLWSDGTEVGAFLMPDDAAELSGSCEPCIWEGKLTTTSDNSYVLYEIPGQILPEEITFAEFAVDVDLESTYQIAPKNTPIQLPVNAFLYESSDEAVVTVNETGMVTPVGIGTADVWVYSLDKAVKNYMTITVKDYVPLEGIAFPVPAMEVAVGETAFPGCILTPANTTRRNVTYTSSNEAVAIVDAAGNVTGIGSGTATITATCEGFTATMDVCVYVRATSLQLSDVAIRAALADGAVELPAVITNEGAETVLSWRSTDENVAVIEDGKLILKGLGTTSLIVTDSRSGLSASCLVVAAEAAAVQIRDMEIVQTNYGHYVLLEDGSLYQWDNMYRKIPTRIATGVKAFDVCFNHGLCAILLGDGTIQYGYVQDYPRFDNSYTFFQGQEITDIAYDNGGQLSWSDFYVLTAEGNAYAWGANNTYGELGVGVAGTVAAPTLINLDGVVDIKTSGSTAWFLTADGKLYGAGDLDKDSAVPVLVDTEVEKLCYADGRYINYLSASGKWKRTAGGSIETGNVDLSGMDSVALCGYNYSGVGIKDGRVYTFEYHSTALTEVPGITNAADVVTYEGTHYIATESGQLFGLGKNDITYNHMAGVTAEAVVTVPVLIPLVPLVEETVSVAGSNLEEDVLTEDSLKLTFNKALNSVSPKLYADGMQVTVNFQVRDYNQLLISRTMGFAEGVAYELVFEAETLHAAGGITNTEELRIAFTWEPSEVTEETTEPAEEAPVIHESILDESIERILTPESLVAKLEAFVDETQYNPSFTGNVILNPISTDTNVTHWLRPTGQTVSSYTQIPLGGNYWGTADETAIGLQMVDYTDFVTYARLMYAPYLTEAPENTFPFVTSVKLINKAGEEVTTVGNEEITFRVTFNRDMDTSIPLLVRFGSAYPYGDYEIKGQYVDARAWEGTYTLNTLIENGNQFFAISGGCSAADDLELQPDEARFGFVIDTTAAQALIMQGTATDTGIQLKWTQDDFDTLMGYNVYRSTKEDGLYTRLNSTVIPTETMEWFDNTVEPGVVYYYNFTVVKTDLTESEPSGKISIMSKDTMAPDIYHSPVANAFTGANLVVSATVTDNLNIVYANLYYRVVGTESWKTVRMNALNDKYSAIIPAADITTAGIEYYIEAFDGVSLTYKGAAEAPYTVAVQEAVGADALGDVDGDGVITNRDALVLLYAINDKYNMSAEEFARADLNGDGDLWAAEALRILQYVSGVVGSVKM